MRFFLIATVLISALAPAAEAFAQTDQPRTQPKMDETQDAKIKAEHLESIPYQPCPAKRQISGWTADVPRSARESILPRIQDAAPMSVGVRSRGFAI